MHGTQPDVTVLIPCLNEENNVAGAMDAVFEASKLIQCLTEVVVIDDGSTDRTSAVVRQYCEEHPSAQVRLVQNPSTKGLSRAFVDGAFGGNGEYYKLVPGDNVEPVETIAAILSERGSADIIVPHYIEIRNRPLFRTLLSRIYTVVVNIASGYRLKYYNGNPLYKRFHVLRFHVECSGFGYQAEFLTRLLHDGATYKEISLVAYDREGSAAISVRNILSVAHSLLTIALRRLRIVLFE
jgi:glycosyltransferase involved in cell wall biosynthesis